MPLTPADKENSTAKGEQGSAMAVVLIVSLIATVSTMAVAMQAYTSFSNGTRQNMAQRAREAAESGLNRLIESLNQDYPEWLIQNFNGTESWPLSSERVGGCRSHTDSEPSISGSSGSEHRSTQGFYRLKAYHFEGTSYYGGRGRFVMEGEVRSKNNQVLASAQVMKEMTVIAKACNSLPGSPNEDESIWPGLFVQNIGDYDRTEIKLKNTKPEQAASVLCTSAEHQCRISNRAWKSNYPPWEKVEFQPDITLPETPSAPQGLTAQTIKPRSCSTFQIPEDIAKTSKHQDADGTWHVYVSSINLTGRRSCDTKLQIGQGPVRLYTSGNINLGPNAKLDTSAVKQAADFMLLGTQPRLNGNCRQNLNIKEPLGTHSNPAKAFIWMPSGCVKFQFTRTEPHSLEGALWAQRYDTTGAGSYPKNYVSISVPEGLPSLIFQRLGVSFGVGQREYLAQGTLNWQSFGR